MYKIFLTFMLIASLNANIVDGVAVVIKGDIITLYALDGRTSNGNNTQSSDDYIAVDQEIIVQDDGTWSVDISNLDDVRYSSASFEIEGDAKTVVTYDGGETEEFVSPGRFDFTQQIKKYCNGACMFSMLIQSDAQVSIKNIMILGPVVAPGIITQEKNIMKPISQAIIDSFNRQSFTSIEPVMQKYVDKIAKEYRGYQLLTRKMPGNILGKRVFSNNYNSGYTKRVANVTLPLINPTTWVEIHLYESMPE